MVNKFTRIKLISRLLSVWSNIICQIGILNQSCMWKLDNRDCMRHLSIWKWIKVHNSQNNLEIFGKACLLVKFLCSWTRPINLLYTAFNINLYIYMYYTHCPLLLSMFVLFAYNSVYLFFFKLVLNSNASFQS